MFFDDSSGWVLLIVSFHKVLCFKIIKSHLGIAIPMCLSGIFLFILYVAVVDTASQNLVPIVPFDEDRLYKYKKSKLKRKYKQTSVLLARCSGLSAGTTALPPSRQARK